MRLMSRPAAAVAPDGDGSGGLPPLPSDFRWGWAIAGTEVEGCGLVNQWTRWSTQHAARLARRAETTGADWDYGAGPGSVPRWDAVRADACAADNYRVGRACEMWDRYPEDFALAGSLGFDAGQISVEWARIEPEPGRWDDDALAGYREMVRCLRANGQEPFVALWHFGNPLWFEDRGGWCWSGAAAAFDRYVRTVVAGFGDDVTYYVTVVEPKVYAARAHLSGWWPPGERSLARFIGCLRGLVHAHKRAFRAVKAARPAALVGAAVNDLVYDAARGPTYPFDRLCGRTGYFLQDALFRRHIVGESDWLGLNYYARRVVRRGRFDEVGDRRSDLGWSLHPDKVEVTLLRLRRHGKPVYVTEFGIADRDDAHRLDYIERTLLGIRRARAAGVDVRGAFYWSLLDNYEWDKGYWPRFGLVHVDRATLAREVRPSGHRIRGLVARHRDHSAALLR